MVLLQNHRSNPGEILSPHFYFGTPSTQERLLTSVASDADAKISSDHQHIAYISSSAGPPTIDSVNIDGTNRQQITEIGNTAPDWEP